MDQWNQIENPDVNPHTYGHLILHKEVRNIKWKKESILKTWCAGITGCLYVEECK